MYDYIKGAIASISPTTAVIETAGVGYSLAISLTTHAAIVGQPQTLLYTHLQVLQDQAPVLYGFATQEERALFRLLISISGIGAAIARTMLSSHTPSELISIIGSGNVAALTKVKGIGAKTAEVVIVKLRDKVVTLPYAADTTSLGAADNSMGKSAEALDALLVLGFSRAATEKVVRKVVTSEPELSVEDIIRKTLSLL